MTDAKPGPLKTAGFAARVARLIGGWPSGTLTSNGYENVRGVTTRLVYEGTLEPDSVWNIGHRYTVGRWHIACQVSLCT